MITVKERIDKISPYFKTMNVDESVIYVQVVLPGGWMVNNNILDREYQVKVSLIENTRTSFYFFTDMANGFDCIFDAIEFTIKHNENAQLKADFFKTKVIELQKIVEEEDLDVLQTLKFTLDNRKRKLRGKKTENTLPTEIVKTMNSSKEPAKELPKEPPKSSIVETETIAETPEDIDNIIATAKRKKKKV